MKEIDELILDDDVRYAEDHEWARYDGDLVRIGISDYAQDQLGDIVYVDLPEIGEEFAKGEEFGTVESVKAVSELYMPVGGKIVTVNDDLDDAPELVNTEPYDGGWIIEIKPIDPGDIDDLMDKDAYIEMLKEGA